MLNALNKLESMFNGLSMFEDYELICKIFDDLGVGSKMEPVGWRATRSTTRSMFTG